MAAGSADRRGPVGIHLRPGWQALVPAAWLEGWKPERFELEEGWTEVVTMGGGAPLVLLPPLPGFKEAWIACAALLAREFRVITNAFDAEYGRAIHLGVPLHPNVGSLHVLEHLGDFHYWQE